MKHTLLLLFSFLTLTLSAQISAPESVNLHLDLNSDDEETTIAVSNGMNGDMSLLWEIELAADFPEEWSTWFCDINLCYSPAVRSCPVDSPNKIEAGQSQRWIFHATSDGFTGTGTAFVNIIDEATGAVVSTTTVNITAGSVGVNDIANLDAVQVYPNPTVDYFKIAEDSEVSKIGVFSLIGKSILLADHTPGNSYNVSDFRNGIYLVRLMDEDGEVIKVVRLSKR